MALSRQSEATALFSTVCHALCDIYIDFPQSVNSGLELSGIKPFYRARGKFQKSSYADRKLQESNFDQTKLLYKSFKLLLM